MLLNWVFLLFLGPPAQAEIILLPQAADVFARPSPESRIIYRLRPQTRISVSTKEYAGFRKVRFKAQGKVRQGYVLQEVFQVSRTTREWAIGGGLMMSALRQGGKSFATEDEVTYQTTEYSSSTVFPLLSVLYGDHGFWRLSGYMRLAEFATTATTNVSSTAQAVTVEAKFLAGSLQRAWPLFGRTFYFGVGVELAKALSVGVKIGGQELTMPEGSEPFYMGGQGFLGGHVFVSPNLSIHGEGQLLVIANQKPMIFGVEGLLSLFYWL